MANILLVDDSKTSKRYLRSIFEDAGHCVIDEADNGKEGIEKYELLKPDLVTMDITMPEMNGLEALKILKATHPEVRIIMITAAGEQINVMEALKFGADDFIQKPSDTQTIIDIVERVLSRNGSNPK